LTVVRNLSNDGGCGTCTYTFGGHVITLFSTTQVSTQAISLPAWQSDVLAKVSDATKVLMRVIPTQVQTHGELCALWLVRLTGAPLAQNAATVLKKPYAPCEEQQPVFLRLI
jgi:hypothetical protein